jgi:hypothetical protein
MQHSGWYSGDKGSSVRIVTRRWLLWYAVNLLRTWNLMSRHLEALVVYSNKTGANNWVTNEEQSSVQLGVQCP